MRAGGRWSAERGVNILDSGAPWYDAYETADGLYVAVGAIEPKFFRELAEKIGLSPEDVATQYDEASWPALREKLTAIFLSRSQRDWVDLLEQSDACFSPVLDLADAISHPHLSARGSFIKTGNFIQPAPAPRFAKAKPETPRAAAGNRRANRCDSRGTWLFRRRGRGVEGLRRRGGSSVSLTYRPLFSG